MDNDKMVIVDSCWGKVRIPADYLGVPRSIPVQLVESDGTLGGSGLFDGKRIVSCEDNQRFAHLAKTIEVRRVGDVVIPTKSLSEIITTVALDGFNYPSQPILST